MSFPLSGVADPFAGCPPTPPPISPDPQYTDEDDGDQSQTNKYKYPFEVAEEVCILAYVLLAHHGPHGKDLLETAIKMAKHDWQITKKEARKS